jgi:poly(A) polymerase
MIKRLFKRLFQPSAAKIASRKKKQVVPRVVEVAEHHIDPTLVSNNAVRVTKTLQEHGFAAFIVGGAVRDLLLGVKPKDFDVATSATPEDVQKLFRRARIIGRRFRLVHVMFGNDTIEVSTFRAGQTEDAETDQHGRVLRDNTFGDQKADAERRDFTVNSLYYDPATQTVVDYMDGVADVSEKRLRVIGDPVKRYREDPVRMLRAVRFAAKLGFSIDAASQAPIKELAPLIKNVPAARLFDEMLKLLLSGHALACLKRLREEGLHHGLLPLLDVVFEQPLGERFVTLALQSTDERVRLGKPTSPSFLFACLLWHEVLKLWADQRARGETPIPALGIAMDQVLETQTQSLAIQRRFAADMREIWGLQPRLERRTGKAPYRLIEHLRFRAGYDFLLLRCEAGECDSERGTWWTEFIAANEAGREELQRELLTRGVLPPAAKKRRRRKRASAAPREARGAADAREGTDGDQKGEA